MKAAQDHAYKPETFTDVCGRPTTNSVPVARRMVLERVNKSLAADRQQIMFDGDRVVWVDLRAAREIDLEEYARRHGLMERFETFGGS